MTRAVLAMRHWMTARAKSDEKAARICDFSKLSIDESAFSADNIIYKITAFKRGFMIAREPQAKRR